MYVCVHMYVRMLTEARRELELQEVPNHLM